MKLIKPYIEFIDPIDRDAILQKIERAGRTCYKSEANITPESASKFVTNLVKRGHLAMIEHVSLTVKFVTDRGVSHEIVRHRVASYAQESTRYVRYGTAAKEADDITFIIPSWCTNLDPGIYKEFSGAELGYANNDIKAYTCNGIDTSDITEPELCFLSSLCHAEWAYNTMMNCSGIQAQHARAVLPNALKTEIVMTANLREWKHFLDLRSKGTTGAPHPDMKVVADMVYDKFHAELPEIFNQEGGNYETYTIKTFDR